MESACVNGMLWEEKQTGKKALLLVNSGDKTVKAKINSLLPDGEYKLNGDIKRKVNIKNGAFSLTMPALTYCYIEA